jgi:TonB-linked SusC/RagA family outer membrane protein
MLRFLLALLLTIATAVCLYAQGYPGSRPVSCRQDNIRLAELFRIIYEQTGITAFYNDEQISSNERISVNFQQEPLDNVLAFLLRRKGMVWCYRKEVFVVAFKKPGDADLGLLPEEKTRTITGRVVNEKAQPLAAVAIIPAADLSGATTDIDGKFILDNVKRNVPLFVRRPGYKSMELYSYADSLYIQLIPMVAPLQEVFVNAMPQNNSTGSVTRINKDEIAGQPVNNVLGALQGRVPGLYINQTTGLPGGGYRIRLRGRNSIESISDPLILLDGLPFPSVYFNGNYINDVGNGSPMSANVAASPLNLLTVNDIAGIEIMKDADAAAIYGARGANGVILINSNAPGGKNEFTANVYSGVGRAVNLVRYLDTKQYLLMRHEGLRNDNRTADSLTDYDMLRWDTTRYTDWQKAMIGGSARISEANVETKGAFFRQALAYRLSGTYHEEGTVYPTKDFGYKKTGSALQLRYTSPNGYWKAGFAGNYVTDHNFLPTTDLTTYATLPPNTPLSHINEKLNFEFGDFENPYAVLLRTSDARSRNGRMQVNAAYEPLDWLAFNVNTGMSILDVNETRIIPISSYPPYPDLTGQSYFFSNLYRNGLINVQAAMKRSLGNSQFNLLLGARLQFDDQELRSYYGYGYTSDSFLLKSNKAPFLDTLERIDTNYRYQSYYGRLEYKLAEKYVARLTLSRDQSSRLGKGSGGATFGSLGLAWVFSGENWLKDSKVLSFGKLRASYGRTGNDLYTRNYSTQTAVPDSVLSGHNSGHTWEKIRKAEMALELGFLKDRVLMTFCYYNNKSSNQLLTGLFKTQSSEDMYLPVNYPAVVTNKGVEIDLEVVPVQRGKLTWITNVNLSFLKNRLAAFPELAKTAYQFYYKEGMSLDMVKGYHFEGVDPQTGIYKIKDVDSNGVFNAEDRIFGQEQGPFCYGGWYNNLRYGNFELSCLLRFAKQNNYNFQYQGSFYMPGTIGNQPLQVQDRWRAPGDDAPVQGYTSSPNSQAMDAFRLARESDRQLTDASYIRMQSISVAYNLPSKFLSRIKMKSCKLYLQGLNLFTISKYNGRDPEITSGAEIYPSLRVITAGIKLSY